MSDTDSLLSGEQDLPPVGTRGRLRLTWSPSHSGHPQVQAVDRLFSELAARIDQFLRGLTRQQGCAANGGLV